MDGDRFVSWILDRSDFLISRCEPHCLLLLYCCGCGHVGDAIALSKRSVMSTAFRAKSPSAAVAPGLARKRGIVKRNPRSDAGVGLATVGVAFDV